MITLLAPPGSLVAGAAVDLGREEAHHARVRRARSGDRVRLLDGAGGTGAGTLVDTGKVEVTEVVEVPRPVGLALAVGAGDKDRFGWLVEKAAELGVTDLIPLDTEHGRTVAGRVQSRHVDKLQRRALDAIKQSGAAWAPTVHLPHTLAELVARHPTGVRWLAAGSGQVPAALPAAAPVLVAIGPEGGFTPAESLQLEGAGFVPVRLGPEVLRFETAALAAAAVIHAMREVSS